MATKNVLVFSLCLCVVRLCSASQIAFEATPKLVREAVDPLTVNCTFQNPTIPHLPSNADDVYMYITSADGTILASVSRGTQAEARQDSDFVKVEGRMSLNQTSYLQITWPSVAYTSNTTRFVCVVHSPNSAGQETLYNAIVLVPVQRVVYADLVNYTYNEKRSLVKLVDDFGKLQQNVRDLNLKLVDEVEKLQQNVRDLNLKLVDEVGKLQQSVKDLNAFNTELITHRENGVKLYCGGSSTFKPGGYGTEMEYNTRVNFRKPFARIPVVMYNMRIVDVPGNQLHRVFYLTSNITTTGFNMICGTWGGTLINSISIDWTATAA